MKTHQRLFHLAITTTTSGIKKTAINHLTTTFNNNNKFSTYISINNNTNIYAFSTFNKNKHNNKQFDDEFINNENDKNKGSFLNNNEKVD